MPGIDVGLVGGGVQKLKHPSPLLIDVGIADYFYNHFTDEDQN